MIVSGGNISFKDQMYIERQWIYPVDNLLKSDNWKGQLCIAIGRFKFAFLQHALKQNLIDPILGRNLKNSSLRKSFYGKTLAFFICPNGNWNTATKTDSTLV